MQQQLAQLFPMNQRLEQVAEVLENVTNKVAYLEADREDSDYESYDGEDVELDLLRGDETKNNSGAPGFLAGEATRREEGVAQTPATRQTS
mgnify:CR=1 FL=1